MLHCDPLPRLGETLNSQAAAMFLRARPASETEVRIVGARAAALAKVSFDRACGGTVPNFKGYRLSPRLTDESNNRRWLLEFTCSRHSQEVLFRWSVNDEAYAAASPR